MTNTRIPGLSFSLKRALGITRANNSSPAQRAFQPHVPVWSVK